MQWLTLAQVRLAAFRGCHSCTRCPLDNQKPHFLRWTYKNAFWSPLRLSSPIGVRVANQNLDKACVVGQWETALHWPSQDQRQGIHHGPVVLPWRGCCCSNRPRTGRLKIEIDHAQTERKGYLLKKCLTGFSKASSRQYDVFCSSPFSRRGSFHQTLTASRWSCGWMGNVSSSARNRNRGPWRLTDDGAKQSARVDKQGGVPPTNNLLQVYYASTWR